MQAPHDGPAEDRRPHGSSICNAFAPRRQRVDPERIAERVERAGCTSHESLLVALATHATIAAPFGDVDLAWIASATARIGDADLLLEVAGVVFAFNTINRIANALQVRLEFRLLREFKPIRGWVERRLASLTGLVYDLSYKHRPRHAHAVLLDRTSALFEHLGVPALPELFDWLCQSPAVLEGILEMLEVNVMRAEIRLDLWQEAAAIAVASRGLPGSGLSRAVEHWLPQGSWHDSSPRLTPAALSGDPDSSLVSACRRYSYQVANSAHTISDEQIRRMSELGLADAELLDLTLAAALFSALAIIEPISAAVAPHSARWGVGVAATSENQIPSALEEELAS